MLNTLKNQDNFQLEQLRSILLEPEFKKMQEIDDKLSSVVNAESISDVLPQAIKIGIKKDSLLMQSLEPAVNELIQSSFKKNSQQMIELLVPIMGAAIKKSIAEALRSWLQAFDTVVERSFSWEGIKWRWEALRTGVSISEVALNRSFLFRVEHIYLIQKSNVKVIAHVSRPDGIETENSAFAAVVDATLTFIRDVFVTHEKPRLETLQLDKFKILFCDDDQFILVAMVRGEPSSELKEKLQDVIEQVQSQRFDLSDELFKQNFEPLLDNAMLERRYLEATNKSQKLTIYIAMAVVGVIVLGFIFVPTVNYWIFKSRSKNFIQDIRAEKQIVLMDFNEVNKNKIRVAVLASDIDHANKKIHELSAKNHLSPSDVQLQVTDPSAFKSQVLIEKDKKYQKLLLSINGMILTQDLIENQQSINELLEKVFSSYVLGIEINKEFIVQLKYPAGSRNMAEALAWKLQRLLELKNVFNYHLIRIEQTANLSELVVSVKNQAVAEVE